MVVAPVTSEDNSELDRQENNDELENFGDELNRQQKELDERKKEIENEKKEITTKSNNLTLLNGFDLYSKDVFPEIKELEITDFMKIPTRKYPSSWDDIIVSVAKTNGVKIRCVHEAMVRYGLSRLNKLIKDVNNKTNIYNKCIFLKRATKFVEIPMERYGEMFSSDEGDIGLSSKTFYVTDDTKQLCVEYASTMFCTVDSIAKSSLMISMNDSLFVKENKDWFIKKYGLNRNKINSHLKTKNEHIRLLLRVYSSQLVDIYNGYLVKIMTGKEVNMENVNEIWDILNHLRRIRELDEDVINYKDLKKNDGKKN